MIKKIRQNGGMSMDDFMALTEEIGDFELYDQVVPEIVFYMPLSTYRLDHIVRRVAHYLDDGLKLVCILNIDRQVVTVYQANGVSPTILTRGEILDGNAVIPGFSIPVAALFEGV